MKLSDIPRKLSELETAPSRSLGQNFLHDQNLAQWIVHQLDIQPGDHIVEIGPGLGALTEFLAEKDVRLTLLEKDRRFISHLRTTFTRPGITTIAGDALDYDLRELWGTGPVKVIGNLPYYVSTPLLAKFTSALSPASRLVFTLQLELVRRLGALPRTKDYGAMTVCVKRRWTTTFLRKLPPSVFYPAPKVDSAVLLLEPRTGEDFQPLDEALFERIVRRGFSERRKQLAKLLPDLRADWPHLTRLLGVAETVRAEELSLSQWETLVAYASPQQAQSAEEIFDVVDEHDCVIGAEPRGVVHVNNLRHRAVHILIFNATGELFLQRRSVWKDRNPGLWDSSAAGHVDTGETYLQAAHRELREEIGIEVATLTAIGRHRPSEANGHEFIEVFRACHEGPFTLAPTEVETGAFFSLEKIRTWTQTAPQDFSPVFLQCIQSAASDDQFTLHDFCKACH